MKFTAQEEYGLRCILTLARAQLDSARRGAGLTASRMACEEAAEPGAIGRPLTVAEVAQREGISVQYASKLFRILGKAGLLESARGCKGGYRLARPAAQITVGEILAVLGGVIYEPETCERYPGDRKFCVHTNDCSIRSLWSGLQHIVDQVLSKVTLNELVGNEQTMGQWIQVHAEDIHLLSPSLTRH